MQGIKTGTGRFVRASDFDSAPTSGSSNPVSSGGVYTALQAKQDSVPYVICSTAANVAAKEATMSGANFVLSTDTRILVMFTYQNTANSPTLNVNGTGAKEIYFKGSQITSGNEIALIGGLLFLVYDGFHWNMVGNYLNTLNTAGAANMTSRQLYPVGALYYGWNEAITYSNSNIYFGSDNEVYSNGKKVAHADVEGGMAIVSNGNTHAAIASGQYVYVKDHSTLSEGMYTAKSAIDANGTLSSSNLTACTSGGMNGLKSEITSLSNQIGNLNNSKANMYYDIEGTQWTYQFPDDSLIMYNVIAIAGVNWANVIIGEMSGWKMLGTNDISGLSFDSSTRTLTIPAWTRIKIFW